MNKPKRQKLTASVLTFVMLFQIIAGVFAPVNIFNLQKNQAHAGWFDMGYGYKKEIKVDHTKVSGDLTNFPMLVSFTDPLFKTTGNGGRVTDANGYDIIFANAAGTTKLDHEIEKYNAATGQIIMWVKIPALSASTDTSIYIYYGNSSITTSQENKTGVWDDGGSNNFKGVWHLKETGTGTAGDYKDSTQYAGNSTNTTGQPALTTGSIGSGQSFNGSSQQISLSGSQTVTSATFSTWVYRSASEISYAGILFSRGTNTSGLDVYAATNDIGYHWNDVNASFEFDSGLNLPLNKWAYVVLTVTPTTATFYMGNDGAVTSATNTMTHTVSTIDALTVGRDIAAGSRYFTGSIDEARFSNVARSSQWISTEYNNQSNPTEFSTLGIEEVSSPTALSSFGYRKAITIDHTKVSGDLVNFPVLINLPTDASLAAHAQADGDDILFTSNSVAWNTGTVNDKLASEIETYTTATGALVAWVKTPNISSTVDTVIYMYYGNGSAATQQNKAAVWDSNTKMVQHMNQNPGGTAPQMLDSTQYQNNGTSYGTMTSGNSVSGQIDGAIGLDGTDDNINASNKSSLNVANAITVEGWIKLNAYASAGKWSTIASKLNTWEDSNYYLHILDNGKVRHIFGDGSAYTAVVTNSTTTLNMWHHVVATRSGTSAANEKIFIDGIEQSVVGGSDRGYSLNSASLLLGSPNTGASSYNINGSIDEVRIANTARSAEWIATEYSNQSQPTEFASLGIEEVSSPVALSSFGYRKAITIDHTKISGDLVNFPVLINLPTDASLAAHAQADGDDILFTLNSVAWNTGTVNDKLASEIETYTTATGSLQAWVKIPNLSSTVDTVIYMYYGHGSVTTQQNKTAVWDSNTKLVQHMNQNPAATAPQMTDSTSNANNGSSYGTMLTGDSVEGKIGKSLDFDGTDDSIDVGNGKSLDITDAITISTWVKSSASNTNRRIISKLDGGAIAGYDFGLGFTGNGELKFGTNNGGWQELTSTQQISDSTWHHVVAYYDKNGGTNNKRIYYDGVIVNQATYAGGISSNVTTVSIGSLTNAGNFFVGQIDETHISNIARSSQWISTEYSNQSNPTEFSSLGIEEVSSPAALSTFGYRKAITIDHTKVAGDLANFPVLINLPTDASLAAHAQTDADDILFASNSVAWNSGTANDKLASEIESYNSTTGSLQAWVKIPNLSSTIDTVIYIYYGNGSATTQQNKTAVWDGNTKMVQHMNQTGTGAAGDYRDSTQFVNNSYNTASQPTATSSGKIGTAESFNSTSQYISVSDSAAIRPASSITFGAWIKPSVVGGYVLDKSTAYNGYGLTTSGTQFLLQVAGWSNIGVTGPNEIANTWQYVVVTFERPNVYFYYNGVRYGPFSRDAAIESSGNPLVIGGTYTWQAADGYQPRPSFNGSIDEVRISNVARSASWISTEYNNQSNPTEFSILGIEEVSSPTALSTFGYRKAITIDHTKVSGDLTNFPVLINLPTDASLAAHAQADGDDVLFTSSSIAWNTGTVNDKLASEIELYTTATGSLQAWVKIPNLSSTVDTVIYMYYGNAAATTQQNKTAVWDTNTKMVQHMNQTGTGTVGDYRDSTQYANHSVINIKQPTPAGGKIDGAESFDGVDDYMDLGNRSSLDTPDLLTVEAWAKPNAGYGLVAPRISEKTQSFIINMDLGGRVSGFAFIGGVQRGTTAAAADIIPVDSWSHIVYSVDTNTGTHVLYINGAVSNTRSYAGKIDINDNTVKIGDSSGAGARNFTGTIDEVRISNTTRSAQWIATEYNNQSSPSTFYSIAGELVSTLAITGSATQMAGNLQTITLTAKDAAGNTMTGFSGDKSVTLSGAAASPSGVNPTCRDKDGNDIAFGSAMTVTFTSGVATCAMRLTKAEAASISSSNFATSTTPLAVTVSPNTINNFLVDTPASGNSGTAFSSTITSRDYYNNTTTLLSGSTAISVSSGTIAPTTIAASNFTDDGVWSGNLTITNITEQPAVTVTATNGSSTGSDTISILGIPQAPGSVSASRNSDTELAVSWQDLSTVEVSYDIERRVQTSGGWGSYSIIASVSAGTTTFIDNATNNPSNPPQADRAYQYRVRGQNSIGYSAYTEDASIHYTTPDTPSNISALRISDSSFSLSYTDNADATDTHRGERCSNSDCASFETSLGTFTTSPQTDNTVSFNSRYRYRVRAEAPGISSNYAASSYEYTTPSAPTIGTITVVSANQITVNWQDTSSWEDGFRVEVSTDGGAYQEITPGTNTVGADISSYLFSSLGDHNYKFRVRAHIGSTSSNVALFSPYSADSSTVYTPSAAPTLQSPAADSSTSITWSWLDNSAYEESFRLHFIAGSYADVNDIAANSTSYQTSSLLPNTKYQTHMHSYRTDTGESIASAPSAEIYTLANIPSNLTATLSSQDHMTLNWQANSNPEGTEYLLENMNTGDMSDWITASSFTTGVLSCETEYSFRVKARNHDNAETAYSSTVTLMSSSCGAPLPQGAYNPPQAPAGDFKLIINDGNKYTDSSKVKLTFSAGVDTARMAIANSADFSQASLVPFEKEAIWDLGNAPDGSHTVYAKFYTKYGVASKVVSDSIILDTTAPIFSLSNLKDKYLTTDNIILKGTTESGAKIGYNLDSRKVGIITADDGTFTLALGTLTQGTHSLKLFAQDVLGNSSDTIQYFLNVDRFAVPVIPQSPITPTVPALPTSPAPITSSPTAPTNPSQPGIDAPKTDTPDMSAPSIDAPVIDPIPVTPEAPLSMQGDWTLLSLKPFPKDITTEDVRMIIEKFPEFKETFQNLGITDFTDAQQIKNASFALPSLSEVMGLKPTDLTALNLPSVTTPISELSAQFKKEIPSNIVFVKTKDDNMDISSSLNFKDGDAGQKISLLAGKSFQLILRPDQDVDSVQGYLAFQSRQTSQADDGLLRKAASLFGLDSSALADENVEEKLVLAEFDYQDDDKDGIWTADIQTPQVSGEYELITVMDYKDVNLGDKTLRLITVVDPEGYVYEDIRGQELHIKNATVSIYWFNDETKKYELWDADKYQQQNPQTTDERGTYSFLVPPGSYYLKAEAAGYITYQSDPFDVAVGSGVHMNLKLVPVYDWKDSITWERMLLAVFGIALFYNFYSDRRERRRTKAKEVV